MTTLSFSSVSPTAAETTWHKDAIIYQVHVKGFFDSNDDGVGDFAGLNQKLGYLQDLGINCIWLMPFFPSPQRDDGYDIADYFNVDPSYGTLEDFELFLENAHSRNIRVITELVVNHTSDQHPWFQRARQAPAGSPEREFYVWSDTNARYRDARIIFTDFETSNWTWDNVADAYFWHRFYHHQPDLNFDNPAVLEAILQVLRFWLDMGVDGFRLDAIPYLIEREGTNCESLPETHAILKKMRKVLDDNYSDRIFLAEANQTPADVRAYFGDGDECHMAFHFPLMPRLFLALSQADRRPIVDALQQTPDIPANCQWAVFLRNHDELTLEMVTDEERDLMYRSYATVARMRLNLGIRRRLSPLLGGVRPRIELLNGLLFSLIGSPVIYYGDEIGMGDNVFLGDRNTVRTPMQWNADRHGGFSQAEFERLYAPANLDAPYGYTAVSVAAQRRDPTSLLHWMRRLIDLRKKTPALGWGDVKLLQPDNRSIFAFLRLFGNDVILVVANLSMHVQPAHLDLSEYAGRSMIEMFGPTAFPEITRDPYFLSLGPYGFYWFKLEHPQPTELNTP